MADWKAGRCLLKELRNSKGWTQEFLSESSGVPRSTISSLENNKYVLDDLSIAYSLAYSLGCVIDDLYDWKES